MDVQKVGALIAESRKQRNMTQKELAEKLHVSDRAVSKWERGLNLPNAELFEPLCVQLDLTILELLRGERNTCPQIPVEEAERVVYDAAALARQKRELRRKLSWACVVVVCLVAIYSAMVWFAGKIVAADHPYPVVTICKIGAGVTEILSHQGACYTPETIATREECLNRVAICLTADVTGPKRPRTFECDWNTLVKFKVDYEADGMVIQVLRWPEGLRGSGAGLELGEKVLFEKIESGSDYDWKFDAEPGYLYAIFVFWGDEYFVEYPFCTTSIYADTTSPITEPDPTEADSVSKYSTPLENQKKYEYRVDPNDGISTDEAALKLATLYMEDMMTESSERTFYITRYESLSVELLPTATMSEVEAFNYGLKDSERADNSWIVEIRVRFQYEGVLDPAGRGVGQWMEQLHQGSPVGFLLTYNDGIYTMQSRWKG